MSLGIPRPMRRLLLRSLRLRDPWLRVPHPVPLERYGAGARRDFCWYFEGTSRVRVTSVADAVSWLLGCEYMRDPELFQEVDHWQHPSTFEQLRRGDCEDFALWGWRQLVHLGLDAEFVAGRWMQPEAQPGNHAWILFREAGRLWVFDPVIRDAGQMVRPLTAVRDEYLPEVSVDGKLQRYVYGGYAVRLWDEHMPSGRVVPA